MNDEARAAWLAGLKPGDTVIDHDDFGPPIAAEVQFIGRRKIYYGPLYCLDWVWREDGHACNETSQHRWIEPMP